MANIVGIPKVNVCKTCGKKCDSNGCACTIRMSEKRLYKRKDDYATWFSCTSYDHP